MNNIPAQEIKRRGISAVDAALLHGPVHVIKNNRPQYVVLSEERYEELIAIQEAATLARIKESLEDIRAGRIHRYSDTETLMQSLTNMPSNSNQE